MRKWLEIHPAAQAGAHVPPLQRGFVAKAGDRVSTVGASPDEDLLPLMNQYCFRCHSSVRYHVFQKEVVYQERAQITVRIKSGNMPQDRVLPQDLRDKMIRLVGQLQ